MRVISCAGYYGTGSSAVTDFFSEFDCIKSLGTTEIKLLQDCDGVGALEMNIIEHPHRHNTSHAIKRFIKAAKFENGNMFSKRYRRLFGDDYMKYTSEYINEIVQLKTPNTWRGDSIERGELFYMLDALISVISKKINRKYWTSLLSLTNEPGYFTAIDRDSFYSATKKFTDKLFQSVGDGYEYVMVDQLTAPSEVSKYMNYVNNLKVVVVDRDPRDVFLEWHLPYYHAQPYSVEDFCKWFKILREHRKTDEPCDNTMLIHFEDLIYKYDETSNKLINFAGLSNQHHSMKKKIFTPEISIKNTRKWEKESGFRKEIDYIEKNLNEYLYPY